MSDDGKVYTFHIKEGIKFSDGSDLTAEDVAKSPMAVPVNLGQYNGGYGRLSTIIESAEATDDYTVELRLTQPYYNTFCVNSAFQPFGIVSSEQLGEDLKAKTLSKQPLMEQARICMKVIMTVRLEFLSATQIIGEKNQK